MSYSENLKIQIESVQATIAKCEQMLSLKSLEDHIVSAWQQVLTEAEENISRLNYTSRMNCFN